MTYQNFTTPAPDDINWRKWIAFALLALLLVVPSCTVVGAYNALNRRDVQVEQAKTKMMSAYQMRHDLAPNLFDMVKDYAKLESSTVTEYARARSAAGSIKLPDGATAEDIAKYAEAQKQFTGALTRLLAVAEATPTLKSSENYSKLQTQLQQIELQSRAARNIYIREIAAFNINVKTFPSNLVAGFFGFGVKPQMEFENAVLKAPRYNKDNQ